VLVAFTNSADCTLAGLSHLNQHSEGEITIRVTQL
jgi:hypothetical protein